MTNALVVRCASALTSMLMAHVGVVQASPKALAPSADPEALYEPKPWQFELGAILGFMVPSTDHNLRTETAVQRSYGFAPEIGLRAGHLFVSEIGLEFEGVWMWTRTEDDSSSDLFAGRVHLLAQLPMGRVAPFAVFAYDWPEIGKMYRIIGGPRHRSDVTAETLRELGMEIPR